MVTFTVTILWRQTNVCGTGATSGGRKSLYILMFPSPADILLTGANSGKLAVGKRI